MAVVHSKWVHGNLVYYDTHLMRWVDAIGPNVCKYLEDFIDTPMSGNDGPLSWTNTITEGGTGDTTFALKQGVAGGVALITTAADENDGYQGQLLGEAFKLASGKPLYFGCRFKVSDATQSDFLVGLCITDADCIGAVSDGAYFVKVDGSTSVNFTLEKASTPTADATASLTCDTDYHIYEFYFDGSTVYHFVDGTLKTKLATTNLPSTEELTVTFEYLTGAGSGADTVEIDWIRCIQINA